MGGLVAFIGRQFARADLAGRLRLIDVDLSGDRFGVGFAGQRLPRHFDEVRIAEIFRAVGIGVFLRLRHHLHGVGAAKAIFLQIKVFEDIEDLHDVDPPGRRRRHGINLIPAIFAANRRALHRLIVSEVGFGDKPAVLFHLVSDLVGDGAFIEGIRTVLGNQLEAFPQVLLYQPVALL